jgi:hypothetical protein
MHLFGNRIHALIGLWILAGLVVVGVNGTALLTLLDEPLVGYSSFVRNADRAFRQYRTRLDTETEKITSGMDLLASWFSPAVVEDKKVTVKPAPDKRPAEKRTVARPVKLPHLRGIVTRRSSDGSTRRLALMDGRIWGEGDRLGDLTVARIGTRGVSLARGDKSWFLKAPDTTYSLTKP